LTGPLVASFVALRTYLFVTPDRDLDVGPYNIHHLYVGLLLIVVGGIPLALFRDAGRGGDLAVVVFAIGLGMALDEWVYLIVTDGSNAAYLYRVSFWGGVTMITLACAYLGALVLTRRRGRWTGNRELGR
jgi:hypothetical protein